MRFAAPLFSLLLLVLSSPLAIGEDWPQFRGATGSGLAAETTRLPVKWSAKSGVAWSTPLPGRANSSPAVTAHRIDLTTQKKDNSLWVVSLDRRTGKVLREVRVGSGKLAAKGPGNLYAHRHNAATPSPAADEDSIYAFFGTGLLVCVDASNGQIRWQRDVVKDFGSYDITFGMGASPRLWGRAVYLACLTKGASFVAAFDRESGEILWKAERRLPAEKDGPDAYSTPTILQTKGREQLLVAGSDHINAYDPENGKEIWLSDGLKIASPYGRIIASPVVCGDTVIATSANPAGAGKGHVLAVTSTATGNISESGKKWKFAKSTPDSSTPICLGGRFYMVTDAGVATCLDVRDGKVIWQKRLSKGPYHASLVAGNNKVYFLGIDGNCTVLDATAKKQARILSVNRLPGTFYATPAIADGVIYLRAYERMFAIGGSR